MQPHNNASPPSSQPTEPKWVSIDSVVKCNRCGRANLAWQQSKRTRNGISVSPAVPAMASLKPTGAASIIASRHSRTLMGWRSQMQTSPSRVLPASPDVERSILGAILLDNLAYNEAAEHLKPEDFSLDSHRRIFSRMVDWRNLPRPIDLITLVEELDGAKNLRRLAMLATSQD